MAKKVSLRVLDESANPPEKAKSFGTKAPAKAKKPQKKPSIDAARQRLGGRISEGDAPPSGLAPGVVVTVAGPRAAAVLGVVVFASRTEVHILLDGARLRRVAPDLVNPYAGDVPLDLAKIAGDARLFARLAEGDAVRYTGDGGETDLITAKVVEKCRWGALVSRPDGAVIAVGFRKLWPATAGGEA